MGFVRRVASRARLVRSGGLDALIKPEIRDDAFHAAIRRVASTEGLSHLLEIGSSAGGGSTEAFVAGILLNPRRPTLHCMEISAPRFEALVQRYAGHDFVRCYRVSSVPLESFPSAAEVEAFYRNEKSKLGMFSLRQVLGWRDQDMKYLEEHGIAGNGIAMIKQANGIECFDAVLIDGSEFTGAAELREVYGARFILLDDICTYKNYANYHGLLRDERYRLVEASEAVRNGYAVFARV